MKKAIFGAVFGAIVAGTAALSAYVPKPPINEQQNFQLMFIQSAGEAIVKQNPRNPQKWTLTLKNVEPEVAYYSERPKKMAGKVTIEDFLDEWTPTRRSSPSGALSTQFSHANAITDGSKKNSNRQIVLSNPRFDKKTKTLTYSVENPAGSASLQEGRHADPVLFIERYN